MTVADITSDFDPNRDKGNAPWWTGNGGKFGNYEVDPVLWEIRRERQIELFGEDSHSMMYVAGRRLPTT